jgi:hypothetical protein
VMFCGGAEGHSVIITSWEKQNSNRFYVKDSFYKLCQPTFFLYDFITLFII